MANQAQMQAAFNAHNPIRHLTHLLLFFLRTDKDTILDMLLINRIQTAAQITRWNNDNRKLQEMYMILLDCAIVWWNLLPEGRN